MSGYLARLVDRAAGPPPGALAPRLGPVFPLSPRLDGDELAVRATRAGIGVQAAPERDVADDRGRAELPSAGGESASPVTGRLTPPRRRAAAGARDAPTTPPVPQEPAARPRVTTVQARAAAAAAEASVGAGDDGRVEARSAPGPGREPAPRRGDGEPPARAVSQAVRRPAVSLAVRPIAVELPARRAETASPPAPRIEVRIGRVEIRRPVAPDPFEWPAAPAVDERPPSGFEDLAAARRYVDRRWS